MTAPQLIYLDNNATSQPLPPVVDAVRDALQSGYANPSSVHQFGQSARHAVECARGQIAALVGADPRDVVFTSGGTESINLAIRGLLAYRGEKCHVVTSTVEHSAVTRLVQQLRREGHTVDEVGVDCNGRLDLDQLAERVTNQTALVSLMWANNETGVLFDINQIARIVETRGATLHVDAVQAAGKIPINVADLPIHLLSISAHKFYGPKGTGALYVRKRTRIRPQIIGGRQERDLRGGTENAPAIIGMGVAAELAADALANDTTLRIAALRDRLESGIVTAVPGAVINGAEAPRICNTTNIGFPSLAAEGMLILLSENGVCASSGSACSSGSLEPSHVLAAMNIPDELAHGSIRFSLSKLTTEAEIDRVIELVPQLVKRLSSAGMRA